MRFLSLTTALCAALVPFLPGVAFGLTPDGNINNSSPVIVNPNTNPGTVIVNPVNPYPTGIVDPNSYPNTVILSPVNPYPTGRVGPINNYGTVIVNPSQVNPQVNPTVQQPTCSGVVMGSPIPRPVPINTATGRPCN